MRTLLLILFLLHSNLLYADLNTGSNTSSGDKVNQIKSKRPIFSISFDKLADENTIYLQVSFPPKSKKGWSKNYRITRVVGEIKINKQGKLGKGKIEDEKDLVDYIESSIGKKI